MSTFGARLKRARTAQGLKQRELASVCRSGQGKPATHSTVSQWEKGDTKPDFDNLLAIAKKLGVSVDWLLGHEAGYGGRSLSREAIELAAAYDQLPKQAQETVKRCLTWASDMADKKQTTAMTMLQHILKNPINF